MKTYSSQKGSAIIAVLIVTMVLTIAIVSILSWSGNERKMTERNTRWLESRNAAEAVTEYGFSQIAQQFSSHANPPSFDPKGANPIVLPPASFWSNSRVTSTSLEVIAGDPSPYALVYIDPNDVNNESDPLKSQWVYRRDVSVVGKATVTSRDGGPPISSYVKQTVVIRGAPLFANAIFYSHNDLEIFPGPEMHVRGPVHCNGNMFVSNQSSGNGLTFHGSVSCSGNIYHAWESSLNSAHGTGSETLGENPVYFLAKDGVSFANMKRSGTATSWLDSTEGASSGVSGLSNLEKLITPAVTTKFVEDAKALWGGNLQTGAMGITAYDPVSYTVPIGVDGSGNPIYADSHTIIEAPSKPAASDPYYEGKMQVEQEKYSSKANLYVRVVLDSATAGSNTTITTGTPEFYGAEGSAAAAGVTDANDPTFAKHLYGRLKLAAPANQVTTTPLVKFSPYNATITTTGTKISSGTNKNKYPNTTRTITAAGETTATSYDPSAASPAKTVISGMYDQREATATDTTYTKGAVDVVEVDVAKIASAVNAIHTNTASNDAFKNPDGTLWTEWNGGIYVEIAQTKLGANVTNTADQTGSLRLVNGQVSSGSTLIPTDERWESGLTVVTNAPMYIKGNFNADGSLSTTSSTTPDDGKTGTNSTTDKSAESPASLGADAITILSSTWNDSTSISAVKPVANSAGTEVAAAFIAGIVKTDQSGSTTSANSGGAHNLPRFLEDWSGRTVGIRGSLVCLYDSRVATGPFSGLYYGAPTRNWGFDDLFKNGNFPPLAPKVISYRRVGFTNLSADAYATEKHRIWPAYY